jgi:hypothetical protein
VISQRYTQPGLLRTIEVILGLPPMNQLDASAIPWSECFSDQPDFAPFTRVANRVPLDQVNPSISELADRVSRRDALLSARLPFEKPDQCPEDELNRILWHAAKGGRTPYPAWAVSPSARDDDD